MFNWILLKRVLIIPDKHMACTTETVLNCFLLKHILFIIKLLHKMHISSNSLFLGMTAQSSV